jgi:multidrug efflux pump subunit AcrA (membrane-fusion protein)
MNKRAAAIGGIVVVGAAAVGLVLVAGAFGGQEDEVTYLTSPAAVEDVRETVSVSGSIRPTDTYELARPAPVRLPVTPT